MHRNWCYIVSPESTIRLIDRDLRLIEIQSKGVVQRYPLKPIPDDLFQTLADFANVGSDQTVDIDEIHAAPITKATICTFNFRQPFYINAATKIIRLTPTDEMIRSKIEYLEGKLLSFQGRRFEETIDDRLMTYRELFLDDSGIDRFRLGVIEMFGEGTFENIQRDPRVTLLIHWVDAKKGVTRSYQINAIAEIAKRGEEFFRYMQVMRPLFSSRFIQSAKVSYIVAYKLWVSDIIDKSLAPRLGF